MNSRILLALMRTTLEAIDDDGVDLVFLWVDGGSEEWQRRRRNDFAQWTSTHPDDLALFGNSAGRYRDNGELRYNLRAVEKFLTNVRRIFVVTDRQRPEWLVESERLTIIDHSELAVDATGSIYDSGNIESYLHRIPGLADRFIYLNDDVFFGAPLDVRTWFTPTMTVYLESASIVSTDRPQPGLPVPVNAAALTNEWMSARYPDYVHVAATFSHAPRPMRRGLMREVEREVPELFTQARSTTFRSWRSPSLLTDFVPRWMVHHGHARLEVFDSLYISTGGPEAADELLMLTSQFGALPFFCLNDTCDEAEPQDPRLVRVRQTLEQILPLPSSFERP